MTLYISSVSFEERCLALVTGLGSARTDDATILVDFNGYENVEPYLFHRQQVVSNVISKGYSLARIEADLGAPLEAINRIEIAIRDSSPDDIVIDISTFPRNYLFCVCRLLAILGIPTHVRYYRPKDYGSELSRGIGLLRAIPGFEGDVGSSGETVLAVILGFEGYKALYAWESIGPSKVVALWGDPPFEPEFLRVSQEKNRDFIDQAGNVIEKVLHTSDALVAKSQLQEVYDEYSRRGSDVSFVLCPLGTKLQSLAAFGFAYENDDVAVAYVSSLIYFTEDYSRGYQEHYTELSLNELISC